MSSANTKVHVPQSCLPKRRINMRGYYNDAETEEENAIKHKHDCEYEEQVYEDGAQWEAVHDTCTMCSCKRGRVVCDRIMCPALTCAEQHTLPGACCPVCQNSPAMAQQPTAVAGSCTFAGQQKPAGSSWHPYIPPNGFDKCITCTCQWDGAAGEYRVSYSKAECPELDCPGREYQPRGGACCRECREPPPPPAVAASTHRDGEMRDQGRAPTPQDILQAGGCRKDSKLYRNGDQWNPRIATIGLLPCVTCHCRDGRMNCTKKKCPSLSCVLTKKQPGTCCPICVDSQRKARQPDKPQRRRDLPLI